MRQRPDSHEARGEAASAPFAQPRQAEWLDAQLDTVEEQLALDEALLEEAHEGIATSAVVRTWMAREPVVVVGSSSRLDEEIDREACAALGVRVCRRPSGGLTVVLGPGCLMWSVIVPHPAGAPPIEQIHADMLSPLQGSLRTAGLAVDRRGSSDLVLLQDDPAAALKFSGNALRVRRHGVLYHGTLLDDFDISLISRVLRHPPREPDYRARRPHGEFLANLHLGRPALESLVRQAFGAVATRYVIPHDRVERLVRERYSREDWTNRL
ncbi:MAG: lipoate--protein ligase family protein [Planctomycetota bacterium]